MSVRANSMPEDSSDRKARLHAIAQSDLEEVARFIIRASGSDMPLSHAVARLSWILLENPARQPDDPIGWLLRAPSGEIAGCLCCAPQKFCLGSTIFTLMMSNSFYVDDSHRGSGTSIFLRYLQLGRQYPLFVSSANPTVAAMWKKLGGFSLANSEEEVLAILRWSPLIAESVYRKTASNLAAQLASSLASPFTVPRPIAGTGEGELSPLSTPEDAAKICSEHHTEKITSCRDLPFLKWRYFSSVDHATRLFAFRPQAGEKPFMVAVRLQNRGYQQQIRALHILDFWGEPTPNPRARGLNLNFALAATLSREYRGQVDMLVFRCLGPEQAHALATHGFKFRSFPAPIAWCLDKHGLLPPQPWYFVPADGDMFL